MAGGAAAGAAAGAAIGAAVGATEPLAKMREPARRERRCALVRVEVVYVMHREFRARGKQPRPPARTRLSPLQPDRTAF